MKKIFIKYINYLYPIFLLLVISFYLFPGDIVSYFIYGDPKPNLTFSNNPFGIKIRTIINTGGYSLNHILVFSFVTFLGLNFYFKDKTFLGALFFVVFSIILELLHFVVPNRSFELIDLIANLIGVIIVLAFLKNKKK